MKTLTRYLVTTWPALLPLVLAIHLGLGMNALPLTQSQWSFVPIVLFVCTSILAIRFRRFRLLFALSMTLLLLYQVPENFEDRNIGVACTALVFLVSVCLPRRLHWSICAIGAGVSLVALAVLPDWPEALRAELYPWFSRPHTGEWQGTEALSVQVWGFISLAVGGLLVRAHRLNEAMSSGLAGAIIGAVGALTFEGQWADSFLIAAPLSLLFSSIEMSYDLAFRDPLTGLPGRRALEEHLKRLSRPFTLAMVDVDHFKRFNDTYGHDAGDEALRMVGSQLAQVGAGGRAFRYGGEEFTVIFSGKTPEQAESVLEALRQKIAKRPFALRDADRPETKPKKKVTKKVATTTLTVSMGMAGATERSQSVDEVLKQADKGLYKAKKAGRNRIASVA